MSAIEEEAKKINASLDFIKPLIEWTHNYSSTQIIFLKLSSLETKNVIEFWYQGTVPVRFYVPKGYVDHIQRHHLMMESFWDQESLQAFEPFIKGKHILDVGANVGNHAVYWGLLGGAASIQSFEPIPETFAILQKNIELNRLSKTVTTHRCALGAHNGTGDPTSRAENRMQATVSARTDALGAIPVRTLDSFRLKTVDFMKIDVEGHTVDMLRGSVETLKRLKPSLYVELFPHEGKECREIIENIGYQFLGSVEEYNYIFVHETKKAEIDALRGIITGEWPY